MKRWFNVDNMTSWIGILAVLAVVVTLALTLPGAREASREDQLAVAQEAIQRAAVQCYALEGMFPPSVAYLEQHYGVTLDHDRYMVYYEVFAANLMPQILVFERTVTP